ncbi:MAG: flagellin [Lachnospiraceae bacterium]
MIVQHNMTALNANRQLGITNSSLAKRTEKLSSGYRVNRSADDAAGLSISEKMRGQIRGLNQASRNAQDGISLIQTAEGAMNEIHSVLQRMRELTVQASNDTYVTADRLAIAKEVRALTSEITRIATQTEFNKMTLLSGGFKSKVLQVGANSSQVISFSISCMTANSLGVGNFQNIGTSNENAVNIAEAIEKFAKGEEYDGTGVGRLAIKDAPNGSKAAGKNITQLISIVNAAISKVSIQRSALGALQNRLDHTVANADNMAENLQSSESKIRDANLADEMVAYSSSSILQQAGQSMLAQANQATQGILSLLG